MKIEEALEELEMYMVYAPSITGGKYGKDVSRRDIDKFVEEVKQYEYVLVEMKNKYIEIIDNYLKECEKETSTAYSWLKPDEIHRLFADVYSTFGYLSIKDFITTNNVREMLEMINDYSGQLTDVYRNSFSHIRSSQTGFLTKYLENDNNWEGSDTDELIV